MKPIQIIALVVLSAGLASGATLYLINQSENGLKSTSSSESANTSDFCNAISVMRDRQTALTRPVLLINYDCESKELEPLKNQVAQRIELWKKEQKLTRASVFYKEMTSVHWTGVNQNDGFYPGSLLKLPLLLNVLKLSESNPSLLDQRYVFNGGLNIPVLEAPETALVPGKDYSVRELLRLCIAESSNDATTMLTNVFNKELYKELFAEVEITVPELEDKFYKISAEDYSKFFRLLYNSTYLNRQRSEYAMEILTQCKFQKGMAKMIPTSTRIAHKFGEHYGDGSLTQFHEGGVVYAADKTYLVVIMTEGHDHQTLVDCVAEISKICFDFKRSQALENLSVRSSEHPKS